MVIADSAILATARHGSGSMTGTWVLVGVVVAVVAGGLGYYLSRARPARRPDRISVLIADTLQTEWADRLGMDAASVREAVLYGSPADLRGKLVGLVSDVEITCDITGAGGRATAIVRCRYRDTARTSPGSSIADQAEATTVTLTLPWEQIPQPFRANYLRDGIVHSSQHWSPPVAA